VKRQDLSDFLNSKTPRLIDMNIQYTMISQQNGPPTPKAYGYAEFLTEEEAAKAIELLKDVEFRGTKLKVLYKLF
jgi:RNA recognition motif-containing protein